MNPGRILLLFIGAVAAVLVIAAFVATRGEARPSRADYEAGVVAARDRVSDALSLTTQSTSPEEVLDRLRMTASASRESADHLVAGLRFFADELDATAEALKGVREPLLKRIEGLNFQGYTRIQRALSALRSAGIEVPLLTGY